MKPDPKAFPFLDKMVMRFPKDRMGEISESFQELADWLITIYEAMNQKKEADSLLQDLHGEYLLRLQERKTYLIIRYKGRVFAGEIYDKSIGYRTYDQDGHSCLEDGTKISHLHQN